MTDQDIAEFCAKAMLDADAFTAGTGARLTAISPGKAVMKLSIIKAHLNGHNIVHGGLLFTFADSCFAVACNSLNQKFVSQQGAMTFLAPAFEGDVLTATSDEVSRRGRTGVYDVTITNQNDEKIALFRGLCRSVKGVYIAQEDSAK